MREKAIIGFALIALVAVAFFTVLGWVITLTMDNVSPLMGLLGGFSAGFVFMLALRPLFFTAKQLAITRSLVLLVGFASALFLSIHDLGLLLINHGLESIGKSQLTSPSVEYKIGIFAIIAFGVWLLNRAWFRQADSAVHTTRTNVIDPLNKSDAVRERFRYEFGVPQNIGKDRTNNEQASLIVEFLEQKNFTIQEMHTKLVEIEEYLGIMSRLRDRFVEFLIWLCRIKLEKLVELSLVRPRQERPEIERYINYVKSYMIGRNDGRQIVAPSANLQKENEGIETGETRASTVDKIRRTLKLVSGLREGGDLASAPLSEASGRTRIIRNAVKLLMSKPEPIVLLGDPGSGKSVTLRTVGIDLCSIQSRRLRPSLVVYVPLGTYSQVLKNGDPGDVEGLIVDNLIRDEDGMTTVNKEEIKRIIPLLIAENRLVVLFDGMDEMDRALYNRRIEWLSTYAKEKENYVKTLFACRINDFSPKFTHRQLVLLSFNRHNVEEYVGREFENFPCEVGNETYMNATLMANALMHKSAFRESVTNPLILNLICRFAKDKTNKKWPETRVAIFEFYVSDLYEIYMKKKASEEPAIELNNLLEGLCQIGFEITRGSAGTVIDLSKVHMRLPAGITKDQFKEVCVGAGIFLPIPSAPNSVMFSHHRLQEYFTARYLASSRGAKALRGQKWDDALDVPRWQETLIFLAVFDPEAPAIQALRKSLDILKIAIIEHEKKSDEATDSGYSSLYEDDETLHVQTRADRLFDSPETERVLAERVVLASSIIREASAKRDTDSIQALQAVLLFVLGGLSRFGRPTTQVRMLWAFRNVPVDGISDYLEPQLTSKISWVRGQALLLMSFAMRSGLSLRHDIVSTMARDLFAGHIFTNFKNYWKAEKSAVESSAGVLLTAVASSVLYLVLAIVASIAMSAVAVSQLPLPYELYQLYVYYVYLMAVPSLAYLFKTFKDFPIRVQLVPPYIIYGTVCTIAMHGVLFAITSFDFFAIGAALIICAIFTFAASVLVSQGVFWVHALPFCVACKLNRSSKFTFLDAVRTASGSELVDREGIPAAAFIGMASGISIILGFLYGIFRVFKYLFPNFMSDDGPSFFMVLVSLIAALLVLKYVFDLFVWIWDKLWVTYSGIGLFVKILVVILLLPICIGVCLAVFALVIWISSLEFFDGVGNILTTGIVLLVLLALVVAVGYAVTRATKNRRVLPVRFIQAASREDWFKRMQAANPAFRTVIIKRTDYGAMDLTAREYVELLDSVHHLFPDDDPGAGDYHQMIDQLNQMIRQDTLYEEIKIEDDSIPVLPDPIVKQLPNPKRS